MFIEVSPTRTSNGSTIMVKTMILIRKLNLLQPLCYTAVFFTTRKPIVLITGVDIPLYCRTHGARRDSVYIRICLIVAIAAARII